MKYLKTPLLVAALAFASFVGPINAEDQLQSYENCTITYDERKGESRGSGTNTIAFRTSQSTWVVNYTFGNGNYLILGAGNLEGKTVNVRFDNGVPTSLKSSYGSGSCRVNSASRR